MDKLSRSINQGGSEGFIETAKIILRECEFLDLDDNDYCLCESVTCMKCPAYAIGDDTPTHKCRVRWMRDWYYAAVIAPTEEKIMYSRED